MVFYSLRLQDREGSLLVNELGLFVGQNYLVAVHRGPMREIGEAQRRWERNQPLLGHGVGGLVHSSASNRLNQVVKTLTGVTIILMSMALVSGIYGMNFRNMPELSWELGYAWALGLMAALGVGLYLILKRVGWL